MGDDEQRKTEVGGTVSVTWENYPRANCHASFRATVDKGGLGKFHHVRGLAPVGEVQLGIGENRDTLYSLGVFDLTEPVTITKPETSGRYQSMLVQNEDQYLKLSTTRPGKYTITRENAGTRYIGVNFRTFVDPNDPADVRESRYSRTRSSWSKRRPARSRSPTGICNPIKKSMRHSGRSITRWTNGRMRSVTSTRSTR